MNDVTLLVLMSLARGMTHGYAIQQDVEEFAGERLGPGTLYGAIERLERKGLIRRLPVEDRRHPYEMTDAGAELLAARVSAMRRMVLVAEAATP